MYRFLALLLLFGFTTSAQPWFPENGNLFRTDVIPRVDIAINPDTLEWIYENVDSELEFHAQFAFTAAGKTDSIDNVGFRLRGNTSRYSAKKSFKVSFNTFVKGQKFEGVEKMNLNGEHNDPSIVRSFLSWDFFHKMQVPSSRCNYVNVYINNEYYGLYMNVEHVDEEFIEKRFDHNSGNLYKCLYGANLTYKGENKNDYKNSGYTLQNNTETDDFSDLIQLTKTLNNSNSSTLPANIEPLFNMNGFLRYLAVETFTGHWDGYSFNMNNYYLYHNQFTNKMEFMPYDADNTFGIDWFGVDWGTRNIYQWYNDGNQVAMTIKALGNQTYKDRYSFFLNQLLTQYADTAALFDEIDTIKQTIAPWAEVDPYRPMDYGWSYQDFLNSYSKTLGAHVKYGIKPYIKTRYESIKSQIKLNPISPIVENVYHNFPLPGQTIEIKTNITDDQPNATAKLFTSINNAAFSEVPFTNPNGTLYIASVPSVNGNASVRYYIEATDASNTKTREPYAGYYTITIGESTASLVINEFMAGNTKTIYDNYGQTEDWIELYNNGNNPVYIGDKYLTDDLSDRTKWKLPNVTLNAGSYFIIWADGDTEQGANHANFSLSKGGEAIGIFDALANNFTAIDTLHYAAHTDDISEGRDQNGQIIPQVNVTPGASNESATMAYLNFNYNLNYQISSGNFDPNTDFIDIAGTFNNWESTDKFIDNNLDGIIRFTLFGFSEAENIEYKARINGTWDECEFKEQGGDGNRKYTPNAFSNTLTHWYNDIESGLSDNNSISLIKIYPMPAKAGFPITIESKYNIEHIDIYSISGQKVSELNPNDPEFKIDEGYLTKGIYIMAIQLSNGQVVSEKIIVN